jgi:hypothetical protein
VLVRSGKEQEAEEKEMGGERKLRWTAAVEDGGR